MVYIFLCVFIFFLGLSELRAAVEEGVPCETPDDVYGICLDIHKCPKLINLLITQSNDLRVRNFLRASTCGFIGNSPMVCCPQPRIDDNPSNTSKTPEPRTEPIDPDPVVTPSTITTKLPVTPNCGYSNVTNTRIVNGNPAKVGEFPWIVALGYKNSKNPKQPKWLCGGSLITDRHILTAGHCVHNRADLYLARVGALDLYSQNDNDKPEDIRLIKAKIHEGYSPVNFTNDIAILTLASTPKIASVWPVCLPVNDPYRSRNFVDYYMTVAGWGSLYFNGPSSSVLQEVVLPVVDNQKCKVAFKGTASVIDERVLCAGYLRGGKDACQGDSGGPLILRNSEGNNTRSYQIGIVSYGFRCAQAGYPGVYTRISQFIEWIQKNLD